jgi:hypothetical protein
MAGCQSTATSRMSESICGPIFVPVADTDHKNAPIIVDPIDNKVGLEGMDPDRRRNFVTLSSHSRVRSNQLEYREKLIVISLGDLWPKTAKTLFSNRDDILFRLGRQIEGH